MADTITLKMVRANSSLIAGVHDTWTVSVPTLAEAHRTLAGYCNSKVDVTAYATGPNGEWLGSGVAGCGVVHSDWN